MTDAPVTAEKNGAPDPGLTELIKIDPERVDGVTRPANGFPILMMKSVGETDAAPQAPQVAEEPSVSGPQDVEVVVVGGGVDVDPIEGELLTPTEKAARRRGAPGAVAPTAPIIPARAPVVDAVPEGAAESEPLEQPHIVKSDAALAPAPATPAPTATPEPSTPPAPAAQKSTPRPVVVLGEHQRMRALAYVTKALDRTLTLDGLLAKADGGTPDGEGNDEKSDLDGAAQVLVLLARLICSEAEELARGDFREATDISVLLDMVNSLRFFIGREEEQSQGSFAPVDDCDEVLIAMSAAGDDLVKEKYTAEQKRQMLADGKAIRNAKGQPSYMIGDKDDLDKAVNAVGRGKGDHDAIRKYIMGRAKDLGATGMIPDNWNADGSLKTAKSAAPAAATTTSGTGSTGAGDLSTLVKNAVAEATKGHEAEVAALRAELAKIANTPIPGGPVLIAPPKERRQDENVTKGAYYRQVAANSSDPDVRRSYRALAIETEAGVAHANA